jgi:hypothetical protein
MKSIIVIIVGIAALSFLINGLINGAANWLESQPSPPDQKFSVVDAYKGCDVVQYTPDNSARYSYFLYCGNQK